jgi:hypothetical protein
MQARPPDTMENSADTRLATAPDSRSPSLGPPSTTAICTDEMRLRNSSGADVWLPPDSPVHFRGRSTPAGEPMPGPFFRACGPSAPRE